MDNWVLKVETKKPKKKLSFFGENQWVRVLWPSIEYLRSRSRGLSIYTESPQFDTVFYISRVVVKDCVYIQNPPPFATVLYISEVEDGDWVRFLWLTYEEKNDDWWLIIMYIQNPTIWHSFVYLRSRSRGLCIYTECPPFDTVLYISEVEVRIV